VNANAEAVEFLYADNGLNDSLRRDYIVRVLCNGNETTTWQFTDGHQKKLIMHGFGLPSALRGFQTFPTNQAKQTIIRTRAPDGRITP